MKALTTDHTCKNCGDLALLEFSTLVTKEINGVLKGKNHYYCSIACRFAERRRFLIKWGLIVTLIGLEMFALEYSLLGLVITPFGPIIIGLAIILYPKRNELYTSMLSDGIAFRQLVELINADETSADPVQSSEPPNLAPVGPDDLYPIVRSKFNPNNPNQIYSELLEAYVEPCCYKTAKKLERNCSCGKIMGYITDY